MKMGFPGGPVSQLRTGCGARRTVNSVRYPRAWQQSHCRVDHQPDSPASHSMKPFLPIAAILAMTSAVRAGDGAPGDQVKAAVQKLADAPNYSWQVTVPSGEKSRFTPGPVEGMTEKGGLTRWKMSFGDRCAEAFTKGDRVAVKTDEGWAKPEERRPPPPGKGDAPPPPDGERRKGDRPQGSKTGFLAHRLQSMKAPALMAADLAGKVTSFKVAGDEFSGELSAEAVKELLAFGHRRDSRNGHAPPEPENPRGSVTFSLKDGQLLKMELRLAATMHFNGSEVALDRFTRIEIKDVGTTKLDIPAEAKKLLDAEPAAPDKKPA